MCKKYKVTKEHKQKIIQAGTEEQPYYTNSSQLPVNFTDDVFEALDLQDDLQCKYTGGCVEKGNLVLTSKGYIPIEEIVSNFNKEEGLKVLSFNKETGKSEWDAVIDAMAIDVSKHDKIRVVGTNKVDIVTSDWHPFFVINDNEIIEKRADELKIGDKLLQSSTCILDEEDRELEEDLAYFIGYFISDGSISTFYDKRNGNNTERHKMRVADCDLNILERVSSIIKKYNFGTGKIMQLDNRSLILHEICSNRLELYNFLNEYGFTPGKKTYTVQFGEKLKSQLNKKNGYALLSGLIDGDGHFSEKDSVIEYSTASYALSEDILWLCNLLGISAKRYLKLDKKYENSINYRIFISHKSISFNLENFNTVKSLKTSLERKIREENIKYNFSKVTAISKVDVEDNQFYDLTTEKNHNYLCGKNGFVFIHNTVFHVYMNEALPDITSCKNLVRKILTNYRMPYISITPTICYCPKHGYLEGYHDYCPFCDKELMNKHAEEIDVGL